VPYAPEQIVATIRDRQAEGAKFDIMVVAEGAKRIGGEESYVDKGSKRLGGIAYQVAEEIQQHIDLEIRVTVLGHVQRGGSPTPRDRVLATRYGLKAADLVHEGRFGQMAALRGDEIVDVPLAEATASLKTVPAHWYETARAFFG
jgi:6-phosphofructokinase 1